MKNGTYDIALGPVSAHSGKTPSSRIVLRARVLEDMIVGYEVSTLRFNESGAGFYCASHQYHVDRYIDRAKESQSGITAAHLCWMTAYDCFTTVCHQHLNQSEPGSLAEIVTADMHYVIAGPKE